MISTKPGIFQSTRIAPPQFQSKQKKRLSRSENKKRITNNILVEYPTELNKKQKETEKG